MMKPPCPSGSFIYSLTQCACNPGHVLSPDGNACVLFQEPAGQLAFSESGSGVKTGLSLPSSIFVFDSIRKITQSQAAFLEATLIMLLSWLLFCFLLRFGRLGDGRGLWFQLRWCISRLDICFASRHWLDDQKFVKKRKTELGGTFSIASCILFVGLFAALLYQIISKRSIEVHTVRATNALDFANFVNDMEFNLTTISNMSCSHLRGLGTVVYGNPGSITRKVNSLSSFANHSCHNTSQGPTVRLKCNNCPLIQNPVYITWQFVDLPNDPATAVCFQFHFYAKSHTDSNHVSFVSGTVKNRSNLEAAPASFRGAGLNVLKFNLFPRIYHNMNDLKLIQPLFQEFLPGSSFIEISQFRASLERSNDGLINITLLINPLSDYVIEIDDRNILGPVSFFADLGGIFCFSIFTFFFFLVQCERRIKTLQNEDSVLHSIRNRRKAQERWDKLRKFVMYTWGTGSFPDDYGSSENATCCHGVVLQSFHQRTSSHEQNHPRRINSLSFSKNAGAPCEKKTTPEHVSRENIATSIKNAPDSAKEVWPSHAMEEHVLKNDRRNGNRADLNAKDASHPQNAFLVGDTLPLPLPPPLEYRDGSEMDLGAMKKNVENLREYSVMMREMLRSTRCALEAATAASCSRSTHDQ